jgi:hypothetical protein
MDEKTTGTNGSTQVPSARQFDLKVEASCPGYHFYPKGEQASSPLVSYDVWTSRRLLGHQRVNSIRGSLRFRTWRAFTGTGPKSVRISLYGKHQSWTGLRDGSLFHATPSPAHKKLRSPGLHNFSNPPPCLPPLDLYQTKGPSFFLVFCTQHRL